jgi:hypothetical protein
VAITTPFPILTFNERILAPTFGYVFDKHWLDPHESIVSMLWKFARQNALPGHLLASQATLDFVDPYEGVEVYRETVNFDRLRQALYLPLKTLRLSVLPQSHRGYLLHAFLRFVVDTPGT